MVDSAVVYNHTALCRERVNVRLAPFEIVLGTGRNLDLKLLSLGCEPADWEDDWKNAHDLVLAFDGCFLV